MATHRPPHRQPAVTEQLYTPQSTIVDFEDLNLWDEWRNRLSSGNDFIVCIAASSKTEMSGTGKTTLGIQLARKFDESPTPFDADDQATLDSETVAQDLYPDLPPRSAILFDEAQGTASSHGVDNRRSMADAVVKMSRAAATYRYKQLPLIIITQSTRWIDSRMMDILDRLILIQEKDHDDGVARGVIFDHYFDDLSSDKQEYTPAVEDIYWRPLPESDEDYQRLHEMKEEAGDPTTSDEGDDKPDEKPDEVQIQDAIYFHDELGWSWRDVADGPGMTYSSEWYRRRYNERQEDDDDD